MQTWGTAKPYDLPYRRCPRWTPKPCCVLSNTVPLGGSLVPATVSLCLPFNLSSQPVTRHSLSAGPAKAGLTEARPRGMRKASTTYLWRWTRPGGEAEAGSP